MKLEVLTKTISRERARSKNDKGERVYQYSCAILADNATSETLVANARITIIGADIGKDEGDIIEIQ